MPTRAIDMIRLTDDGGGDVVNKYRWTVSKSETALLQTPILGESGKGIWRKWT